MMLIPLFLVQSLCLFFLMQPATAFPADMKCSFPTDVGTSMPGMCDSGECLSVYSSSRTLKVVDNHGVELKDGGTYLPGATLTVSLSGIIGMVLYEASSGTFTSKTMHIMPGCSNRVFTDARNPVAVLSPPLTGTVTINCNWQRKKDAVFVTNTITLTALTPTIAPTTTAEPTTFAPSFADGDSAAPVGGSGGTPTSSGNISDSNVSTSQAAAVIVGAVVAVIVCMCLVVYVALRNRDNDMKNKQIDDKSFLAATSPFHEQHQQQQQQQRDDEAGLTDRLSFVPPSMPKSNFFKGKVTMPPPKTYNNSDNNNNDSSSDL